MPEIRIVPDILTVADTPEHRAALSITSQQHDRAKARHRALLSIEDFG